MMVGSVGAETHSMSEYDIWSVVGEKSKHRWKSGFAPWNLFMAKWENETQLEVEEPRKHKKNWVKSLKKDLISKLNLWGTGYWNNTCSWPYLGKVVVVGYGKQSVHQTREFKILFFLQLVSGKITALGYGGWHLLW